MQRKSKYKITHQKTRKIGIVKGLIVLTFRCSEQHHQRKQNVRTIKPFKMPIFRVFCWAILFLLHRRFPPGLSITDVIQREVREEILYELTTELQVFYLTFSTFVLVNCISGKPYNKLLTDLSCSVCTSEISDLYFHADHNTLRWSRFVLKNIGPIFHLCRLHARSVSGNQRRIPLKNTNVYTGYEKYL